MIRPPRFTAALIAAGLVHALVAGILLLLSRSAAWANTVAFLLAFWISFFGQLRVAFPHAPQPLSVAVRRFVAAALVAFAVNQVTLLTLLWRTDWPEYPTLLLTTGAATVLLLGLCQHWVFREPR